MAADAEKSPRAVASDAQSPKPPHCLRSRWRYQPHSTPPEAPQTARERPSGATQALRAPVTPSGVLPGPPEPATRLPGVSAVARPTESGPRSKRAYLITM